VAGAAGAYFAAVMIKVNFVLLSHFQNADVNGYVLDRFRSNALVLKGKFYDSHIVV
jgi:hypothetical protein